MCFLLQLKDEFLPPFLSKNNSNNNKGNRSIEKSIIMARDLEKEKQIELAAIWGGECTGAHRYPARRRGRNKSLPDGHEGPEKGNPDDDDVLSMSDGDEIVGSEKRNSAKESEKKKRKKEASEYRLHCFVEPGTEKNDVRTVFEAYNPKVEIRTSQKGNLLNKTYFAVVTFANKAMGLHAVQSLDGTNQQDLLGTPKLKLSLMLSREQSKIVRKKMNQKLKRSREDRLSNEMREDAEFIKQFLKGNIKS